MALIITIIILHGKIHVICLHSKMKILTWVSLYAVLAKNGNTVIERCSASLQGKTYITRLLYNVTCISVISVLNGVKREGWCFTSIEVPKPGNYGHGAMLLMMPGSYMGVDYQRKYVYY